jgi:hypothetical protein
VFHCFGGGGDSVDDGDAAVFGEVLTEVCHSGAAQDDHIDVVLGDGLFASRAILSRAVEPGIQVPDGDLTCSREVHRIPQLLSHGGISVNGSGLGQGHSCIVGVEVNTNLAGSGVDDRFTPLT